MNFSILTLQHIICTFEKLKHFFKAEAPWKLDNSTDKLGMMAHGYNSRLGKLGQEHGELKASLGFIVSPRTVKAILQQDTISRGKKSKTKTNTQKQKKKTVQRVNEMCDSRAWMTEIQETLPLAREAETPAGQQHSVEVSVSTKVCRQDGLSQGWRGTFWLGPRGRIPENAFPNSSQIPDASGCCPRRYEVDQK